MLNLAIALIPIAVTVWGIWWLERIFRILGSRKSRPVMNAIRRSYPLWALAALPDYWLIEAATGIYALVLCGMAFYMAEKLRHRLEWEEQIRELREDGQRLIQELQGALMHARHIQQQRQKLAKYGCPAGFRCREMGLNGRGDCLNLTVCQSLRCWPQELS